MIFEGQVAVVAKENGYLLLKKAFRLEFINWTFKLWEGGNTFFFQILVRLMNCVFAELLK